MSEGNGHKPELVTLTIDGKEVQVPKGTNLIEAALKSGVEIPYYCYHPHLSVAGNCRMCQVHVEGMPKLTIACNTGANEGMVVHTQATNHEVADAQRATLEFLLINHPLDCTVCDEAGHCKLQDYYYQYNGKASRFVETKQHQVKAESFGPEIVYDGERCIVCTRCVRFCDEVTGTSELGLFNRGDKAVIGIAGEQELDNALDGSVVDLCPVGALTHKRWRFNTRIWYTKETDTVCAGCSTGCSAKVAIRDEQVVFVKARLNSAVNQEWMCNEGRYGFDRFQPSERLQSALLAGQTASIDDAVQKGASQKPNPDGSDAAIFLSPFLTLEELWLAREYIEKVLGLAPDGKHLAVQLTKRELSAVEAVLVSPDYAPNARALDLLEANLTSDDWRQDASNRYRALLERVRSGEVKHLLAIGAQAVRDEDIDDSFLNGLRQATSSVAIGTTLLKDFAVNLPARTANEKTGIYVTQHMHLQRVHSLLQAPQGTLPEWMLLKKLAKAAGKNLLPEDVIDERSLFRHMVTKVDALRGLSLAKIGQNGIAFQDILSAAAPQSSGAVPQVSI